MLSLSKHGADKLGVKNVRQNAALHGGDAACSRSAKCHYTGLTTNSRMGS